jgi:hypothetical protein
LFSKVKVTKKSSGGTDQVKCQAGQGGGGEGSLHRQTLYELGLP